jgi:hypothetical protein
VLDAVQDLAGDAAVLLATQDVDAALPRATRTLLLRPVGPRVEIALVATEALPPPYAPVPFAPFLTEGSA